jgi:Calcium-dependent channel, 7TM region, putative phosphate
MIQILNVYVCKYDMGGKLWPLVHNTTVFSLVLTQIIAIGVFGLKHSKFSSGFTIPLVIGTLLFNEYCRQRFYSIFTSLSIQVSFSVSVFMCLQFLIVYWRGQWITVSLKLYLLNTIPRIIVYWRACLEKSAR